MNVQLTINPNFESVIPPMTTAELVLLEDNILADGKVLMPIVVWNGTIIDGHKRFKIVGKHPEIQFTITELFFEDEYEAIAWICKNQLGRRNLPEEYKKYLIGKRYDAEKKIAKFHGNQYTLGKESGVGQNDPHQKKKHGTRTQVAEETNTSESYVKRADVYARGVDAIEEIAPGMKDEILSGTISTTDEEVMSAAKMSPEEIKKLAEDLRLPKRERKEKREKSQPIEESILDSMLGAVNQFVGTCGNYLVRFPRLLEDAYYKEKVRGILNVARKYLDEIEGEIK